MKIKVILKLRLQKWVGFIHIGLPDFVQLSVICRIKLETISYVKQSVIPEVFIGNLGLIYEIPAKASAQHDWVTYRNDDIAESCG